MRQFETLEFEYDKPVAELGSKQDEVVVHHEYILIQELENLDCTQDVAGNDPEVIVHLKVSPSHLEHQLACHPNP